jgi:ATP-dependent DNA helicase RecQ
MPNADPASADEVLRQVFGFDGFREGQQAVVDRLLDGKSVLAIFPTGAGKSLCYQLPALMLDGVTVVISPLIALMKDQIDFLVSKGVAAARLDSSLDAAGARDVYQKLRDGTLKILYVAPERLANERFLSTLSRLTISLLAVDEAHCISEWGHNFRPDYLKLAPLAKRLNVGRVLGLTATATPPVAKQIAAAFEIAEGDVVRTGFYRSNLAMMITPAQSGDRKQLLVQHIKKRERGPTIVYVTLQRTAEEVAAYLNRSGIDAVAYHAGMDAEDRHRVQDEFMASDKKVVVATIAFGMGIDKSNIRYVYHFNVPKSLENYAQEIGRAGRDGKPSTCEMLASADDLVTLENFTFGDTPTPDAVAGILKDVLSLGEQFDVSTSELSSAHDTRPLVVETLLTYLQLDGYLASTGPFYSEYKFQSRQPLEEIFQKFDANRAHFLRRVFKHARRAKTWSNIDIHATALSLGEPRERVVAAINYFEEQGDLVLQVAGVRHGYRLLRTPDDLAALTDVMTRRFAEREARDVGRLNEVVAFASHEGCKTAKLLAYFGEPMPNDCGHCGWCRGHRPGPIPPPSHRAPGNGEAELVDALRDEHHAALASPRQLARFLCGIPSPSVSRAKLTKDPRYGVLGGVPFRQVLEFVTAR